MIFLWLVGGTVLVVVPFFLWHDPYSLWPSLYAGGIGAAVYLIALQFYFMRKSPKTGMNILFGVVLAVLLVTSYSHWKTMDTMSAWQRTRIGLIRAVIANGIFVSEDVCERSVPVFAAFHKQQKKKGIAPLFAEFHAGKINNGLFPTTYSEYNPTRRYVHYQSDTAVVLVSVDTVAQGLQSDYRNADGSTGRVQVMTTLTSREVRYERNN
ncbi:MAG: hypothetical protein WCX28_08210 [Bacteriovoracaceae bacterium]